MATPPPINEQQDNYENSVSRTRNIRIEKRNQTKAEGTNKTKVTRAQLKRRGRMSRLALNQYTKAKMRAKQGGKTKGVSLKDRAKASSVNMGIFSWTIPLWLIFQLPIAVMNILFFGIANVVLGISQEIKEIKEGDTVIGTVIRFTFGAIERVFDTLNEAINFFTGIDLSAILESVNPVNLYMTTLALLLGYALIILLVMMLIYLGSGLKPLSGKGAPSKIGTFILCLMGYVIPILNLFPWTVFWAAAVWKNPK